MRPLGFAILLAASVSGCFGATPPEETVPPTGLAKGEGMKEAVLYRQAVALRHDGPVEFPPVTGAANWSLLRFTLRLETPAPCTIVHGPNGFGTASKLDFKSENGTQVTLPVPRQNHCGAPAAGDKTFPPVEGPAAGDRWTVSTDARGVGATFVVTVTGLGSVD